MVPGEAGNSSCEIFQFRRARSGLGGPEEERDGGPGERPAGEPGGGRGAGLRLPEVPGGGRPGGPAAGRPHAAAGPLRPAPPGDVRARRGGEAARKGGDGVGNFGKWRMEGGWRVPPEASRAPGRPALGRDASATASPRRRVREGEGGRALGG